MATLAHAGSGTISASTKKINVATTDIPTFVFDSPKPSENDHPVIFAIPVARGLMSIMVGAGGRVLGTNPGYTSSDFQVDKP